MNFQEKIAIFPCIGLGDALISSVLAYNLKNQGYTVQVFHPILPDLQLLFPSLSFAKRPQDIRQLADWQIGIFFYERLSWMQEAIEKFYSKKIILNPIATSQKDYLYWEQGEFDGNLSFVDNLLVYLRKKWKMSHPTKENGICLPPFVQKRKYLNRVILHPSSSRPSKNWTKAKFLRLAEKLTEKGYDPWFILTQEEKKHWPGVQIPENLDLYSIALFIAESGWMIGNDSGIGHLASCMGVPTLTICRSKMGINFWRPAWTEGRVVLPPSWVPNLKGIRWRDKKWQLFISVNKVYAEFLKLCQTSISCY